MKRITTLKQLHDASLSRESVIVHGPLGFAFSKPCPAAFVINLPGVLIQRLFDRGMFIYRKAKP